MERERAQTLHSVGFGDQLGDERRSDVALPKKCGAPKNLLPTFRLEQQEQNHSSMSKRDESSSSHHDDSEAVVVVPQQKTKIRVMEASGQSESDRRQLRQSYRKLATKISHKVEEIENPDSETFGNLREKNNVLFGQVRYTREAVLDGDSLNQLASGASKQLDRLVEVSTAKKE